MALAERSTELLHGLPRGWTRARLELTVEEPEQSHRAAIILGPAGPARSGNRFFLTVYAGAERLGASADLVRRVLTRLDQEGVRGRLTMAGMESEAAEAAPEPARSGVETLAEGWDALVQTFPPDWSHCYVEVALDSSDFVQRAALLLAPANPAGFGERTALRFRAARVLGYGVSAGMARRCLERLDQERITGSVRVLRVVSEDRPVATQGPVWRIGGRSV